MDVIEATEGTTTFFVPVQDNRNNSRPAPPVFFNRRMEINRDATVLLLWVLKPSDYLDSMGATGVRGLRVANECGVPVTINDKDPEAIPLILQNVARSGLPITVTCRDACSLLYEQSFDAVDIDPFGTPAPFINPGIRGCRRFLLVTATDTAPLCGAHLQAGIRRYFARPANTGYHAEVGLRILLGFVVRETIKYDRGIEPLFCFARETLCAPEPHAHPGCPGCRPDHCPDRFYDAVPVLCLPRGTARDGTCIRHLPVLRRTAPPDRTTVPGKTFLR